MTENRSVIVTGRKGCRCEKGLGDWGRGGWSGKGFNVISGMMEIYHILTGVVVTWTYVIDIKHIGKEIILIKHVL